jgi:hypothetical protein
LLSNDETPKEIVYNRYWFNGLFPGNFHQNLVNDLEKMENWNRCFDAVDLFTRKLEYSTSTFEYSQGKKWSKSVEKRVNFEVKMHTFSPSGHELI